MVFGILGAFAIEDWNARRSDRVLERAYLQELANDLRADDAELDVNRLAALRRALAVGRLLDNAGFPPVQLRTPAFSVPLDLSDTLTAPECFALTACLINYRSFDGSRAAYDELVSSGNLRVLRSRTLVRKLAAYYAEMASEIDADRSIGRPDVIALAVALNRHGVPISRALPAERPTESDLADPIRSDAELRALLGQVRDGAMWQVGRIETVGRVPLADVLAEVQAELARAMR